MSPRSRIGELIRDSSSFLVLSHTNPDGDAVGSTLALGHLLHSLGKKTYLYNETGLPSQFNWIADSLDIQSDPPREGFDWAVVLDCSDPSRYGTEIASFLPRRKVINIDHHSDNSGFGEINWVEGRSSVGEMIALLASDMGVAPRGALGESLYLALVSDSGFFSYSNTNGQTLRVAADILDAGLDLDRFNAGLQRQWSLNTIKLHAEALQDAYLAGQGRIGVVKVSEQAFARTGTTWQDSEGLVNYMRRVRGVMVSLCLKEQEPNRVKLSLRSWGEVDVQAIASQLGGGGHPNAAGAVLETDLGQAERKSIECIRDHLPESAGSY